MRYTSQNVRSRSTVRSKTPSFVTELPLVVNEQQTATLLARLEAARQIYNACLGHSLKRREQYIKHPDYNTARRLPKGKARSTAFSNLAEALGFTEYALHHYATQFNHSWLADHLDSNTVQTLASRAFKAVQEYHFGSRGRPRFKSYNQLDSVEGKTNKQGILWRKTAENSGYEVRWSDLVLPAVLNLDDPVILHGLQARVKYVRLVRRKLNGLNRFYVQLVCEGKPYQNPDNPLGKGTVGLDIGPSTIAIVADTQAHLLLFCAQLVRRQQAIRRLQRQLDRQRRANNPDNYNQDGTIRKGPKRWHQSRRQRDTERKLAELYRQQAAYRKSLHGQLANLVLSLGDDIRLEKLSYRAFQKRFGRSVAFRGPGSFVTMLKRKAANAGATVTEFSTATTKLSQTCHHCGKVEKKSLNERWHHFECGVHAQRDLYSAFLATCVQDNRLNADRARTAWSGRDTVLRTALSDAQRAQLAIGQALPASFGLSRSQSQSSGKAKSQLIKAHSQATRAAVREVSHLSEPPEFIQGE